MNLFQEFATSDVKCKRVVGNGLSKDNSAHKAEFMAHPNAKQQGLPVPVVLQQSMEGEQADEELFHITEEERSLLQLERRRKVSGDDNIWHQLDGELVDKQLTEEIQQLSLKEQENILFDVHGIAFEGQDDPPDVDKRLEEIENELHKIRKKQAYERAMYWDPDYVCDRSFRLLFLRCDRFRSQVAAQRIVRHFQVKQEYFGDGPELARNILLSDLSPQDFAALESGFIQVLPARDTAGRFIVSIATMHCPDNCSIKNLIRAMWYMFYTVMLDEESQCMGVVSIKSNYGVNARHESFSLAKQIYRINSALPKKLGAFHYCYDKASIKPFMRGVQLFLAKDMRTRFRAHFGNHDKIMFELQTYGIPTQYHPILPDGNILLEWHKEWLQAKRMQEESEPCLKSVIVPRRFDVLFGRGKFSREHTGNLRALHLVEMHRTEYERSGKNEKTAIADLIVQIIHESLGRFLKWEKEGWVEVDAFVARDKVSHFFRHLRSKTLIKDGSSTDISGSSKPESSLGTKHRSNVDGESGVVNIAFRSGQRP